MMMRECILVHKKIAARSWLVHIGGSQAQVANSNYLP
jgi:hypothetical protein